MKVKKAQVGKAVAKKKAAKDSVESEMFPKKMIPKEKSNYETGKIAKMLESGKPKASKAAPVKKKMKSGGSLGMKSVKAGYDKNPGVTRADIIVAAKKEAKYGTKMKKAKSGASLSPSKNSVSSKLGGYKNVIGKNYSGKAKSGAKMSKCKYGC